VGLGLVVLPAAGDDADGVGDALGDDDALGDGEAPGGEGVAPDRLSDELPVHAAAITAAQPSTVSCARTPSSSQDSHLRTTHAQRRIGVVRERDHGQVKFVHTNATCVAPNRTTHRRPRLSCCVCVLDFRDPRGGHGCRSGGAKALSAVRA
jgi:hypothetical protein